MVVLAKHESKASILLGIPPKGFSGVSCVGQILLGISMEVSKNFKGPTGDYNFEIQNFDL
jgi:hypothetical protein